MKMFLFLIKELYYLLQFFVCSLEFGKIQCINSPIVFLGEVDSFINLEIYFIFLMKGIGNNRQYFQMLITCILLASSGSSKNLQSSGKQFVKLNIDNSEIKNQKSPLSGVNIDLLHFKEMFPLNSIIIESTKSKKNLKSKKQILKEIQYQLFPIEGYIGLFVFSGHGYFNGAMLIQTKQHPNGQRLTLEEIYDLWHKRVYEGQRQRWLCIVLDCCYAGKMAARLKNNRKLSEYEKVDVFCSSGPNNTSFDLQKFGGTLIAKLWSKFFPDYILPHEKKKVKKMFLQANPVKLTGQNGVWSKLQLIKW